MEVTINRSDRIDIALERRNIKPQKDMLNEWKTAKDLSNKRQLRWSKVEWRDLHV